ncbi:uncharacterized protein BP01DRAFT_384663 [Aspergillus saccharolyticus JOP 1030-1]|uniref:Uncharacterized protein n=1 Tax=Aspergillus saccharolyticus JOP 1030-1 TaxID=1450539 RepID=A0A319A7Q1_9EURO|nr:hypothetical protein BP01DRAFT_384663 [Aspergillus saccharolyticus JOP 1030-1]PYH43212.1 hypothetical protein BP01DRAFT_384663 [Aspergillus saccharolyticus JOP 1030-1]
MISHRHHIQPLAESPGSCQRSIRNRRNLLHTNPQLHEVDIFNVARPQPRGASFFGIPLSSIKGQPFGVDASWQLPNWGSVEQVKAITKRGEAAMQQELGQLAARAAQYTRQLQDRCLQINMAGREIKGIDKQIEAQVAHMAVIDHDIPTQQRAADDAVAMEAFLRSKFIREELYV